MRKLIARWESRGGKSWYELFQLSTGFVYYGEKCSGHFNGSNTEEAIIEMEKKIAMFESVKMKRTL